METIITENNHEIKINNGWIDFILAIKLECSNCLKEFGPLDFELINHYSSDSRNDTGCICSKCAKRLAHPHLKEMKRKAIKQAI